MRYLSIDVSTSTLLSLLSLIILVACAPPSWNPRHRFSSVNNVSTGLSYARSSTNSVTSRGRLINSTAADQSMSCEKHLVSSAHEVETVTSTQGDDVEIVCEVPHGSQRVDFMLPDGQLVRRKMMTIGHRDDKYSLNERYQMSWFLNILEISSVDAGLYKCMADSRIVHEYKLTVHFPAKISRLWASPSPLRENSDVTVQCKAEGNPPPIITIRVYNSSGVLHEAIEGPVYIIRQASRQVYNAECSVENDMIFKDKRSLTIIPEFPPNLSMFDVFPVRKWLAQIRCDINAYPMRRYEWLVNGVQLSEKTLSGVSFSIQTKIHNLHSASLILAIKNPTQISRNVTFTCEAENHLATIGQSISTNEWMYRAGGSNANALSVSIDKQHHHRKITVLVDQSSSGSPVLNDANSLIWVFIFINFCKIL